MSFYRYTRLLTRLLITKTSITNERQQIHRWVAPTLKELKKRRDEIGPEKHEPRSSFLEWNYDAELYAFAKRLNEPFDDNLLRRAFTHRSYNFKQKTIDVADNLELIKEGDGIISQHILETYKSSQIPDELVNVIHKYLTTEKMLAFVGLHLGIKDLILTGEFPIEDSTMADTFKALIGALNQSDCLDRAKKFIDDFLLVQMIDKNLYDLWNLDNPYDYLLKLFGKKQLETRLCYQSAINTILANYQVGIYDGDQKNLLGIGWGESVAIAQEMAALDAIKRYYSTKR